jgi:hypothetical protein
LFRNTFKKWHADRFRHWPRFHSPQQQEAQEFLQFLFSVYGMNGQEDCGAVSRQDFYYGVATVPRSETPWEFVRSNKDKKQGVLWNTPYQMLRDTPSKDRSLEKFLVREEKIWNTRTKHKKCSFNAIRTTHTLTGFADMLVFSLERAHPTTNSVYRFRVSIPDTLTDRRGKTLSLHGIICHDGDTPDSGHYTAIARSTQDHQWYYYDDTNLPLQKINDWRSVPRVLTHCVLIFYVRLD